MIKAFGVAAIIIGMGLIGLAFSHGLYRRKRELEQIRFGLQLLETEIVFAQRPLAYALKNCGARLTGEIGTIFKLGGETLLSGEGASGETALLQAICDRERYLSLNRSEISTLKRLATGLGLSDIEDQKTKLRFFQRQLDEEIARATEEGNKWQKIYGAGGWVLGLLLALILI